MKRITSSSLIVTLIIFLSIFHSNNASAVSNGEPCTKLEQTKKVGKTVLKCVGNNRLQLWIQMPKNLPEFKKLEKTTVKWKSKLEKYNFQIPIELDNIDSITSESNYLKDLRDNYDKNSEENYQKSLKLKEEAVALTAISQKYVDSSNEKKIILDAKLADYKSAIAKTNAYYSQYQSALDSRAATFSCAILKDFGFVGSCYNNSYQDALDVQTIRNYNSLEAASNSAFQIYQTAYDDWLIAWNQGTKNVEKAQLALDMSELHSLKSEEFKNSRTQTDEKIKSIDDFLYVSEYISGLNSELRVNFLKAEKTINIFSKSKSNNYQSRYQNVFLAIEFLDRASRVLEALKVSKGVYSSSDLMLENLEVWKPASYFLGSNYPEIKNDSKTDFAWKWVSISSCEVYKNCKRIYIVSNNDCNSATISLDFKNDSGVPESQSSSQVFKLEKGKIFVVEVESKFSNSATRVGIREFSCVST